MLASFCGVHSAQAALNPTVTATQQRDFTRIMFGWPEKVRFKVESAGNNVTLTFNQPADMNLASVRQTMGNSLVNYQLSADKTQLVLQFDQPYRVRHFISGNANGLDILGSAPATNPTPPPPVSAAAPALPPSGALNKPVTQAAPPPVATTPVIPVALAQNTSPAAITSDAPISPAVPPMASAPPAPERPPLPAAPAASTTAIVPTEQPVPAQPAAVAAPQSASAPIAAAPVPATPAPAGDIAPTPPATTAAVEAVEIPASAAAEIIPADAQAVIATPPAAPDKAVPPASPEASPTSSTDPFLITTQSLATGAEVRFPWRSRVAAAVFKRNDVIWIAFNEKREIKLALLKSILPASVQDVQVVDVPGHTVLRLQTDGSISAKAMKPDNSTQWWVVLSVYQQLPSTPVAIEFRTAGPTKPNIFLPVLEYSAPIRITDPVSGEPIHITPFFKPGEGVYPARQLADLELLQSTQGLAYVEKSDFVRTQPSRTGLKIMSKYGLNLSSDLPKLALEELESLQASSITWFPYDSWKVPADTFLEERRKLEQGLIGASDIRANSLRLKLAQLFLGAGMVDESLAWIRLIRESNPSFYEERKLAALEGAGYFLKDQYTAALDRFKAKELRDSKEQKLWLDALKIFESERPRFDYLDYHPTYISKYPPKLQEKLAIIAADNYINRKSFNRALNTLDTLSVSGVDESVMPYVDFLLGKISAESKKYDAAKQIWEPLAKDSEDRFVRARAEFALVSMEYINGDLPLTDAIARLDRLRIVWRGDSLELNLLNYLGQLYVENKDYLNALRAWQELIQQFPESPYAPAVAREMAKTFNHLFAEGGADDMQPLQAMSIFFEFRQLMPVGEAGDIMSQNLATRLAKVDLLDRAAALLEHQIRFRQEKQARSKLGTQLALVYLLNRQPQKALDTLELTGYGKNPKSLNVKRTRLAAMAHADLDQPERALDMLSLDNSREADELRLRLYWKMKSWPNVITMAESVLADRSDLTAPLTDDERETLLQLSIAYMFERDRNQLQYLRNYFEPLLTDGPDKDIFMFVTNANGPIDPQQFDQFAKQITTIEDFMAIYKKRIDEMDIKSSVN